MKVGCDGNQRLLVEGKLFLDVGKQRVDLVRVCIVDGRGDNRHDEQAERLGCGAHSSESLSGNRPNIFRDFHWFPLVSGLPETLEPANLQTKVITNPTEIHHINCKFPRSPYCHVDCDVTGFQVSTCFRHFGKLMFPFAYRYFEL